MSFPFCRGVDRGMGSVFMEPGMLVEPTVSPGCPAFRVLVAQLCPIPSNPIDHSLPGSSVCGILQARILEWGPPPGDLPNPGVEPKCLMSPASAGGFFTTNATWEDCVCVCVSESLCSTAVTNTMLYINRTSIKK